MAVSVNPLVSGTDQILMRASKTVTFTGAAGFGQVGNGTIFTVIGEVLFFKWGMFGVTTPTSAGGGTISVGVAASVAFLVAATTATTITAGSLWTTATPTASIVNTPNLWSLGGVLATDDITFTVAVGDVTAGAVRVECYWLPMSSDGMVV